MMKKNTVDVAIVGAGPVGLYSAFYCGLRKLSTVVFESLDLVGGQLNSLYPEKSIYDLPGFPEVKAKDFIQNLEDQVARVADFVTLELQCNIEGIEKQDDGSFLVKTTKGECIAKSIILTIGNGAFSPRKLGIENEETFKNIYYFISHLETFRDRDVVIFGGGDSAVDWCLMLEPIAKSVSIVHRRPEFRAKESSVEALENSTIKIYTPYTAQELVGDGEVATAITVKHAESDEVLSLPFDDLIVNYGVVSSLGFISNWDVEIVKNKISVDRMQQTTIPGVFACGDICAYEGREVQIATGLAEGIVASAAAQRFVFPNLRSRPIR